MGQVHSLTTVAELHIYILMNSVTKQYVNMLLCLVSSPSIGTVLFSDVTIIFVTL